MEELTKFVNKYGTKGHKQHLSYNITPRGSVNLRNQSMLFTQKQNQRSQRNSTVVRRNSKFFKSYLRQQSKRFSKQIISNLFIGKKQTIMKLLILQLQTKYQNRDQQTVEATARIIAEQNIFPQFNNDYKIIRMIARYITVIETKFGQIIYSQNSVNHFLHKILDGCITVKIKRNLINIDGQNIRKDKKNQKCLQMSMLKYKGNQQNFNEQYQMILKQKGQLIENVHQFKQVRDSQATCISQTGIIVKIQYDYYYQALKSYLHSKAILKMIRNCSLFCKYTLKQTQKLLEKTNKLSLTKNQILFNENASIFQQENKKMYFIVEGELNIMKKISGKYEILCTVNDGYIVGDQAIFLSDKKIRQYTISVKSLYVDLLQINMKVYMDWLKINGTTIEKNIQGKNSVIQKLNHYNRILESVQMTKSSIIKNYPIQSLEQYKRHKLKNITNIIGPIEQKVANLQKIKKKRQNFHNSGSQVSFQKPLFTRKDFPALCNSLKRFASQQKKALEYINKFKTTQVK